MVLKELGIRFETPIEILEDNEGAIKLGENKMSSSRSKHIELRHHVIRYHNDKGTIKLTHCSSSRMIADMLTKILPKPRFESLRNMVMTDEHVDVNNDRYKSARL